MIDISTGVVTEIIRCEEAITELFVYVDGKREKAINYNKLTGTIKPGDKVVLNTTAMKLGLGSGGFHFIMANYSHGGLSSPEGGHLMKLRYTPFQIKTLSVEEEDSRYHEKIAAFKSLKGLPVIIGSVHSQLPASIAGLLSIKNIKPVYIMTDGGALPLAFSKTVSFLKKNDLIEGTITVGHAFGGDLEAVNIYTGLIAAKEVFNAKVAIVIMGPGIAGTGSKYGHTGIEQGEIINSVATLGGQPIAVCRMSFKDPRKRHRGISHHTITALKEVALKRAILPLPKLSPEKEKIIYTQLQESEIINKHEIMLKDAAFALDVAKKLNLPLHTMGRGLDDDPEYFLAAAAAGIVAAEI